MSRIVFCILSVLVVSFFPVAICSAEQAFVDGVTLLSPTSDIEIPEGDDFATIELRNSWDFDDRRDFAWEEKYDPASINVEESIWSGTTSDSYDTGGETYAGSVVYPLFGGTAQHAPSGGIQGDYDLPQSGIVHRVDTTKYTYLSFRMNHTDRTTLGIRWEDDVTKSDFFVDQDSPGIEFVDWTYNYSLQSQVAQDWYHYFFDLRNLSQYATDVTGAWEGDVYSIRIEPSGSALNGAVTQFDWMRLSDPNSAPQLTVTWQATIASGYYTVNLYMDTDNNGYNGTPLVSFNETSDLGTMSLPSAALPPGRYYFYVVAVDTGGMGTVYRSDYSARVRITAKPEIAIRAPSPLSGSDYATNVVGNAWDMDSQADIRNLDLQEYPDESSRNFVDASFVESTKAELGGKYFTATTISHSGEDQGEDDPFATEGDARIVLNTAPEEPIDPDKYRYLNYRLRADDTNAPTVLDKLLGNWGSFPVYWNRDQSVDAGGTIENFVYEGWQVYTIDLWKAEQEGTSWRSYDRISNLSLRPLETTTATNFKLDWVVLMAESRSDTGSYTIEYEIRDADSTEFTVSLYYDTDSSGNDGTLIETLTNIPLGVSQYTWDTSELEDGSSYFIYAVVSDGTNSQSIYSQTKVRIGPYTETRSAVPFDFDGDGISDETVYRPSTGQFFQNRSASVPVSIQWEAGEQFHPLSADFDGDDIADLALMFEFHGYYVWYAHLSGSNELYYRLWGMSGDQPVVADYNGNGKDEIAVFRGGDWYILDEDDKVTTRSWGLADDVAVPADYDNDGKADFAVWRPSTGVWWIVNSGDTSGVHAKAFSVKQWGLTDDIPLPANWLGDAKADLGVFRPSTGTWFVRQVRESDYVATQWGIEEDIPVVGDFNGDSMLDFSVYRPSAGTWYHYFRTNLSSQFQFGVADDRIPHRYFESDD